MSPRSVKIFAVGSIAIVAVLWTGLFAATRWAGLRLNDNPPRPVVDDTMGTADNLKPLWPVPAFSFPDQDGQTVTNASLLGHVWVADFIYTQCTTACPVLSAKLVMLQKQIADPSVRFVSFSVDPAHDTPAALAAYRTLWHGDAARWSLLSTDPAGLDKFTAGMKVVAEHQDDKVNPIVHSDLFFLVDKGGSVRGIYGSANDSQLDQLAVDVGWLAGGAGSPRPQTDAGQTAVDRGRELSTSMGCMGCHTRPAIAPPLAGLAGSPVKLDDGRTVWADAAYLKESITDPAAKIVQGYQKSMPAYGHLLTAGQQADLLAWLESGADASATNQPATAPVELLVDPVCHMKITVDAATPRVVRDGKTYYFCSETCRDKFLAAHKPGTPK
jgi:protein SCO1/2